jgi:hypothetical protein
MRLWSLHPKYLDRRGLVALWREALLAQAVLAGRTRGYRYHPQLRRFRESVAPRAYIATYLREVHAEATRRGFQFDAAKIRGGRASRQLVVTSGQVSYEWAHLKNKLRIRAPAWLRKLRGVTMPEVHPLFRVIKGGTAKWERGPTKTSGR